jgi:hypothetical protein
MGTMWHGVATTVSIITIAIESFLKSIFFAKTDRGFAQD